MKHLSTTLLFICAAVASANPVLEKRASPQGIDVSEFQPNVNWNSVKANGVTFAYIKASEGTTSVNRKFTSQYTGATNAGLIRGVYHFARPDSSSGTVQATFFVGRGGSWVADGITLPGAVDLEANPNGAMCYGLSPAAMVSWIKDFSNTYRTLTRRYPVIYTTTSWWTSCTGNNAAFGGSNPLWIARYASSVGPLPAGWSSYTFWQYSDKGPNPGDADVFNGNTAQLKQFARGG